MPKLIAPLTATAVQKLLKTKGTHFVGGVAGLALQVTPPNGASWLLVTPINGKPRQLGLGPYREVSLAAARDAAYLIKNRIRAGEDPVADRIAVKKQAIIAGKNLTFDLAVDDYLDAHGAIYKHQKTIDMWRSMMTRYASPMIGKKALREINTADVMSIVEPIWLSHRSTASTLRMRIEKLLDWGRVHGYRDGENPARWRGHLQLTLPKAAAGHRVEHHAAMPYQQLPEFMTRLRAMAGVTSRCLEFAIYTAARSNEARGARWSEIDLEGGLWTIPAERMKAKVEHTVPLAPQVVRFLKGLDRFEEQDLVFSARGGDLPLAGETLAQQMSRMTGGAYKVHGMRSAFRDWAGETTAHPREVIEHALAHQLKDKTEASYARGTLLAKRRALMIDFATYILE